MSAISEKPELGAASNGLTIGRPSPSRQISAASSINVMTTINDVDSTHSLTPSNSRQPNEKFAATSPFYNHSPTRHSLDIAKSESKQNINIINTSASYDTDVEALTPQKTNGNRLNGTRTNPDCPVWPGQGALKRKKKMMRKERGRQALCGWMAGMPKKTQMWIKVVIALLVIGAAIGIGIGVSKAVGGGVWKDKHTSNAPIDGQSG